MNAFAVANTDPHGMLIGGLIWAVATLLYFTPVIVAMIRRVPNGGSVLVINLFLGWTLIGWIVALAMACRSKRQPRAYVPPGWGYPPQQGPQR